jgi:hypothetical protein
MIKKLTGARLVPRAIAGPTVSGIRSCNSVNYRPRTDRGQDDDAEPLGVLAAALADLTRDVTTSQPRTVSLSYFACTARRFPNLRMEPEDVLASGDKVVARVRATGTHEVS